MPSLISGTTITAVVNNAPPIPGYGIGSDIKVLLATTSAAGLSNFVARADHQHPHGVQTDPTLHALATGSANGFMSSTYAAQLNQIIGSATPQTVALTGSAGSATSASASDHVHAHGSLAAGSALHALADNSHSGFIPHLAGVQGLVLTDNGDGTASFLPAGTASSVTGGTITPNLGQAKEYQVNMTSNATIANPSGSLAIGQRVIFTLNQDSTGYRSLSWGNKWKDVARFMPRQGPNQVSAIEFVSNGDGTFSVRSFDGIAAKLFAYVTDFGAVGDGTTDDTAAIQAAINASLYGATHFKILLPSLTYKTTDTIHLGYGETFRQVTFEGDNYNYDGSGGWDGPAIIPTFSDRPCLNIQGGRGTTIKNVGLFGKLQTWISSHNFGDVGGANTLDDTVAANWDDPGLSAHAESRYAPYAGITIDAYSGVQPATHYPDVTFPPISGINTQYGKDFSSDCLIENVVINGFNTGVANQPCDADGNGDFTKLRRVQIVNCKWGISVGNTQSRNVSIDNVQMGIVYTCLTNGLHGRQSGVFNGTISNLAVGEVINLINFNGGMSYAGPLTFLHAYGEAMWRIGDASFGAASDTSLAFQSCRFSFDLHSTTGRGVPATLFGPGTGSDPADQVLRGCILGNFLGVASFGSKYIRNEGTQFFPVGAALPVSHTYQALALNVLAGGFVPSTIVPIPGQRIKFVPYNVDTLNPAAGGLQVIGDGYNGAKRSQCCPAAAQTVAAFGDGGFDNVPVAMLPTAIDKTVITGASLSNLTLIFSWAGLTTAQANVIGGAPGDVIWDDETGTVFFIRARTGTQITAVQQNNYKPDGMGGFTPITAISLNTGNFYVQNSRIYTPSYTLLGDFTSGSPTVANCGRADGYFGFSSDIQVNDSFYSHPYREGIVAANGSCLVSNVNQGANTITMTGNAAYTAARKRLAFFVRLPPSNV